MTEYSITRKQTNQPSRAVQIFLTTLLIALPHSSCASTHEAQTYFVKVAEERYDGNVEYLPNESESMLICLNRPKSRPGNPLHPVRFIVFDVSRKEVVFEDSLDNADVRWLSDHRIEVRETPEVVSVDDERGSGYIFDSHTRARTPIPAYRDGNQ
jgi:hypothetical protein